MKTTKTIVFALFTALAFVNCSFVYESDPQIDNTSHTASADFTFNFKTAEKDIVVLSSINGTVDVTGVNEFDKITIWGERVVESSSVEDAEAHLQQLKVAIAENHNGLWIETDQPKTAEGRQYTVHYHLQLPHHMQLEIQQVNGLVHIDSLSAKIDVQVTNGNVSFEKIFGDLEVQVVNGNVTSDLNLIKNSVCKINVVNGSIEQKLPVTTSARFSAQVDNGNITMSEIALQGAVYSAKQVKGIFGTGLGEIILATTNGNIDIKGY